MVKIGIQGDRGSTNEEAAEIFIQKYGLRDAQIVYLISTRAVLQALASGQIEFGTLAIRTSRGGWVEESTRAILEHNFCKLDQIEIPIDHVLLKRPDAEIQRPARIVSHPQALKVHGRFLHRQFPDLQLLPEEDTGLAARKLREGAYPPGTLIVAPRRCAKIYQLDIFPLELATNRGYTATIWLVRAAGSTNR